MKQHLKVAKCGPTGDGNDRNILDRPSAALSLGPVLNKTDPGAVWGEMNRARLKSADFGEPRHPGSGSFSTFGPSLLLVSSTNPPLTLNQPRTEVCSAAAVLIRTPPIHCLSSWVSSA